MSGHNWIEDAISANRIKASTDGRLAYLIAAKSHGAAADVWFGIGAGGKLGTYTDETLTTPTAEWTKD
jgi:hypothetical protein